jgi:hypothetical protein
VNAQKLIDRLTAECPALGDRVYHLRKITEIEHAEFDTPAAFVVARPPAFGEADGLGALYSQSKRRRYAVFLRALAPEGEDEPLVQAADEVFAALAGWIPDDEPDVQIEIDAPEEQAPEGLLLTWVINVSYQDYQRTVR